MIRPAEPRDMAAIVEMGEAFFAEAGWAARAKFCRDSFTETASALMKNGILLVLDKGGEAVGMASAISSPAYWNKKVFIGQELWLYIKPAHRKGAGAELLTQLESAAKARNVKFFGMVAEHGLRHEALAQVYKRAGYALAEHTFCKAL
ncbi:NAT_SF domain containing protein [uncultured Caudovirales phage]|uniref:NAT_SF domain containing protein n=1 Tax=uncultured Caudovirales phage TaxID=2100421 RepID=A0A6J5QAY0_9CAUD|nr:NAT_SF domain containing protein [uncultured Caudovirales phage]CAB4178691.1 NAT_SF domain containing protein [uncultured Caudovirales phage]CAB4187991.1 NAT_SF domain containing protein [uncultured Caudovirales phage]CAB4220342.1 NAT_SF domain containing protein [uncultured Caudovirales phage]